MFNGAKSPTTPGGSMVVGVVGSKVYNLILLLHIAAAIVGFGAVVLNGLYNNKAMKVGGREGAAISIANEQVSTIGEYAIYAVFVLGLALVGLSDKVYGFDKAWVGAAMGLYIVGIGVSHAIVIPGHRQLNAQLTQ